MKAGEAKILPAKGEDYTSVTFYPDLSKFKMEKLDADTIALFTRRAYDITGSSKGVKVYLNGKRLPVSQPCLPPHLVDPFMRFQWFSQIKGFKDYVDLYIKNKVDDTTNAPLKLVHEVVNDRWEVGVTLSDKGFQQVSFVNSIATTKVRAPILLSDGHWTSVFFGWLRVCYDREVVMLITLLTKWWTNCWKWSRRRRRMLESISSHFRFHSLPWNPYLLLCNVCCWSLCISWD